MPLAERVAVLNPDGTILDSLYTLPLAGVFS